MSHNDDLKRATRIHEDCWPISLKWKPCLPTMADWCRRVDEFFKVKRQLDQRRARQAQPTAQDRQRGQEYGRNDT